MGWFTRSKKSDKNSVPKTEIWVICPSCKAHIYKEEWENNLKVCPKCMFHDKLTYKERIKLIIDDDTYQELNPGITTTDHLNFVDSKGRYSDKASQAVAKTGMNESVKTGTGRIKRIAVVIAIMDFRFLGGSLGSGTGEKILLAAEYALKHKLPYIIISSSGGARMHEGIVSLMQMAKTCAGIARLNESGIPYISVLTHPTTGGVSASYAMVGDINVAEPGSLIGFAGRRVIEQTIKEKLPDDFQTAEYLLEHGFIDKIVKRTEMKDFLHKVLVYATASR